MWFRARILLMAERQVFFLIFLGKSFVINIFFVPLHMGLWMRLPSAYLCVKNELSNINYLQVTERLE